MIDALPVSRPKATDMCAYVSMLGTPVLIFGYASRSIPSKARGGVLHCVPQKPHSLLIRSKEVMVDRMA